MKILPPTCEKCLSDFKEGLSELKEMVELESKNPKGGNAEEKIIRTFELTHELALNTIGEYFRKQGRPPFSGSRDATVEAFNEDLIDDGEGWLDMIICRIKYNPLYPENYRETMVKNIIKRYIQLFENFDRKMSAKLGI